MLMLPFLIAGFFIVKNIPEIRRYVRLERM